MVDTAHGHSEKVLENIIKKIKKIIKNIPVCVGNVATGEAAKKLYNSGADIIKVGIGTWLNMYYKNGSRYWCASDICNS